MAIKLRTHSECSLEAAQAFNNSCHELQKPFLVMQRKSYYGQVF